MDEKKEISFEDAMKELEEIVAALEAGGLSLEDSYSLFQKGMDLSKYCTLCLEKIEKKIQVLTLENGETTEEDFSKDAD